MLMNAFGGALVGKLGADGSYGIGVRASSQTAAHTAKAGAQSAQGALGIAVKIEDGNVGVLYAVVAEVLAQLDIGTAEQRAKLDSFHTPRMLNTMGVATGRRVFSVALEASR
jgi:L-asparaginase II